MTAAFELWMTADGQRLRPSAEGWNAAEICRRPEEGGIIYFPETPVAIPSEDRAFLLDRKQAEGQFHKNIAYRPATGRVTGRKSESPNEQERLRGICRDRWPVLRICCRPASGPARPTTAGCWISIMS